MPPNRPRRPDGTPYDPARSVRISDEIWAGVNRRANYESVTASHVLATFAEAYAKGLINLPRTVQVFTPPPAAGEL